MTYGSPSPVATYRLLGTERQLRKADGDKAGQHVAWLLRVGLCENVEGTQAAAIEFLTTGEYPSAHLAWECEAAHSEKQIAVAEQAAKERDAEKYERAIRAIQRSQRRRERIIAYVRERSAKLEQARHDEPGCSVVVPLARPVTARARERRSPCARRPSNTAASEGPSDPPPPAVATVAPNGRLRDPGWLCPSWAHVVSDDELTEFPEALDRFRLDFADHALTDPAYQEWVAFRYPHWTPERARLFVAWQPPDPFSIEQMGVSQ